MAGADRSSDSGSYDGAMADHHTTSSTTTDYEKHHEIVHDDTDRENKIEAAAAEGHDADTPSNIGYLLDERGELKRQRSIAEQASLALAKTRSNASKHQNGASDLEKGVTTEGDGDKDTHAGESDPNIVWWDGPDDPENPMNWPSWRKVLTCVIISFLTFVTPLASSIFAPGVPDLMKDFRSDSNALASFVVSVYVLGFAFGPLIMAPMSELYGRSIVYHVSNVGFVAFLVGCALAPDLNSLIVFRFLCGCFGASPLTNGGGSIADIIPQEKRGSAMAAFSVGPLLGPIIGPVAGGFLTEAKGWRWVFWILAIVAGTVTVIMLLCMRETYAPVILQKKTARLRKETGNELLRSKLDIGLSPRDHFYRSIIRPLKMLIRSPIVALFAVYIAVVYGYLYLMFTSMTEVFQKTYHFSTSITGLVFLGMGVGSMAGLGYFSATSDRHIKKMSKIEGKGMKPEYRLKQLPVGAFLLPGGFFIYGWTAQYHVHWILPIIGTGIIGMGNIIIFMSLQLYLVDAFTIFAASSLAANTVVRSVAGAILPLAGLSMYDALGLGWGNSLLGFIALALAPLPFWIMAKGEWMRTRWELKDL
ncbi:bicyclomycin resistance protein [Diaporthe sp. PMI_573]|nr:bicyclomycin resistance protein [Diaporthaceae sp. PMI_573]